jgi:hypothetical protein
MIKKDKINFIVTGFLVLILIFAIKNAGRSLSKPKKRKQLSPKTMKQKQSSHVSYLSKDTLPDELSKVSATTVFEALDKISLNLKVEADPFVFGRKQDKGPKKVLLSGIIADKAEPKAIINETIVGVGDTIGGNIIVEIVPDKVILSNGEKEFELRLGE